MSVYFHVNKHFKNTQDNMYPCIFLVEKIPPKDQTYFYFRYLVETISKKKIPQIPVMEINRHVVFDPVNERILKQKERLNTKNKYQSIEQH